MSGVPSVTLITTEIPSHTHTLSATPGLAAGRDPTNNPLARSRNGNAYSTAANLVTMSPQAISPSGSSLPHNNMQPYLGLTFIIALQGIFPSRP
jgi:microcystin-dependent protein